MVIKFTYLSALLFSFSSIGYSALLAKFITQISAKEIVAQTLTLGLYLLAMGIGANRVSRRVPKTPIDCLFRIELLVAFLGAIAIPALYLMVSYFTAFFWNLFPQISESTQKPYFQILALQPFSILIGFLSGMEIPLLINIHNPNQERKFGLILGLCYFGNLLGIVTTATFLIPFFDLISAGVFLGLLNLLAAFFLSLAQKSLLNLRKTSVALLPAIAIVLASHWAIWITQFYLKTFYADLHPVKKSFAAAKNYAQTISNLPTIERYQSKYQAIDIVPEGFTSSIGAKTNWGLYLNQQTQFTEKTIVLYHESMVHGALNLYKKIPRKVLVLGGGDGLLVTELLKYESVEEIILVELDPMMLDLATKHPFLSSLNKYSLTNPRVHVIVDDAFRFLRKNKNKFEAIFVDFPYPNSYDLSKLFSTEFYRILKYNLTGDGFCILDAPVIDLDPFSGRIPILKPQEIIYHSLKAAGFENLFFFGLIESFVYVSSAPVKGFDYATLSPRIQNIGFVNTHQLDDEALAINKDKPVVNSIFRPKRFQ
ncbi:MAG: hypothetical protein A4S09_10175 [Proteobacteria bacterium SG_bin7]|nr:MAG: hypothetical protein A4S09_10175 [Proteobacteria bacterium SG_bin7]